MNYNVVWEISLDEDSPLEAAKTAHQWQRDFMAECVQFYVQEDGCNELFSVDLMEDDEEAVIPVVGYVPLIKAKPAIKTFLAQRYDCEGEAYGLYEVPETLRESYEKLFNDLLNSVEQDEDMLEYELERHGIIRVFAERFDA